MAYTNIGSHNQANQNHAGFRWIWEIEESALPAELTTHNDHDDHVNIEAAQAMPLAQLQQLVQGTRASWATGDCRSIVVSGAPGLTADPDVGLNMDRRGDVRLQGEQFRDRMLAALFHGEPLFTDEQVESTAQLLRQGSAMVAILRSSVRPGSRSDSKMYRSLEFQRGS